MHEYKIKIHLHPSIVGKREIIEGKVGENISILDAILYLLSNKKEIQDLILDEKNIRNGFLILNEKIELKTTKKIHTIIKEDTDIKIIPISHGG